MNRRATTFIRLLGQATSATLGYGRLYNWYAVNAANFAPTDWGLPTVAQMNTLITNAGGTSYAGGTLKSRSLNHWTAPVSYYDPDYGFELYGAGDRNGTSGLFSSINNMTRIGAYAPYTAWPELYVSSSSTLVYNLVVTSGVYKTQGISIRLIYNGTGTPSSTLTDYDGNVYDVVNIGTQYWTKQNWKCTHLNDGTDIPEVTDNTAWAGLTTGSWCYYNNDSGNL